MTTMKKAQGGAKTTKKPKTASQRIGDLTLRDVKNSAETALNLSTLGGYGAIKKGVKKLTGMKSGGTMKKAQNGVNTLLPGGYAPKALKDKYGGMPAKSKTKAKSTIEEATPKEIKKYGLSGSRSAKSGTSINKYQMGGFVSNEFAAKSSIKAKPKSKFIDSPIKTTRGKDINAFQGKKGMLAKSGAKMKKCKTGCK